MEYWRKQGHEVEYAYGYDPVLANASDVTFIDVCDYNAIVATTGGPNGDSWVFRGKRLVIRAIDIDLWAGHYMNVDWSKVSDVIFIAKHMKEFAEKNVDFAVHGTRVHLIPCGVDMDKFTLKKDMTPNNKVAFASELWHAKGVDRMLEIAYSLPDYEFHVLGKWCLDTWHEDWVKYFIADNNMKNVFFYDYVDDMNEWLEDKSYALCCSDKEAFSYAIAEGMAKGLVPVVHNFHGSKDIWESGAVFSSTEEAVNLIKGCKPTDQFRQALGYFGYTMENMMKQINEACGLDSGTEI